MLYTDILAYGVIVMVFVLSMGAIFDWGPRA